MNANNFRVWEQVQPDFCSNDLFCTKWFEPGLIKLWYTKQQMTLNFIEKTRGYFDWIDIIQIYNTQKTEMIMNCIDNSMLIQWNASQLIA